MTPSYFRIGGLMMDLPAGFENRCKQFLDNFLKAVDEFHTLLSGNRIFQNERRASDRSLLKTRSTGDFPDRACAAAA